MLRIFGHFVPVPEVILGAAEILLVAAAVYFVAKLAKTIALYGERHSVKPGITGWAQVNYRYGASIEDATAKLAYDLYCVKNRTLLFDLVILVHTVRVTPFGEGLRRHR